MIAYGVKIVDFIPHTTVRWPKLAGRFEEGRCETSRKSTHDPRFPVA